LAIADKDMKLLWGRAAGYCSNPDCRTKVSETNHAGESYLTGEQAHIVARQAGGPRGEAMGGPDTYANLVLLCPTCHRRVDKSPEGTFPVETLLAWKAEHEAWVSSWSECKKMAKVSELMGFISGLLAENRHYFERYGPRSEIAQENPGSSAYAIWEARKLDVILPNNRKIVKALKVNNDIIPSDVYKDVIMFFDHASSYEQNQYGRIESYQLFPESFAKAVEYWKSQ
jgi:hypothetical protein